MIKSSLLFLIGFSLPVSTALQNVLMIALLVIILAKSIYRNNIWTVKKNVANLWCLLLYLLFIVRSYHSHATIHQIVHQLKVFAWAIYLPILYVYMRTNYRYHQYVLYGILSGALLSLIFSYGCWAFNYPILHGAKFASWANIWAPFRAHSIHCMFLAILSAWCLYNILNQQCSNKIKILSLTIIILSSINVYYMISSLTGNFIFAIAIGLTLLQKNFKKGVIVFLSILLVITPLLFFSSKNFRVKIINSWNSTLAFEQHQIPTTINTTEDNNSSLLLRWNFYDYSWQIIKHSFWTGYGTGSFENEYKKITHGNELISTKNPHSDYLLVMIELGIIAIILLIAIFATIFYYSLFYLKGFEQLLGLIVSICYAISCIFNPYLSDSVVGISFAVMSAFVIIHVIKNPKRYSSIKK
jgi:O-antigen ligase